MRSIFQKLLTSASDSLTRPRPVPFVRKMQAVLLTVTVILVTFLLSYQNLFQQDMDLSHAGPWAVGKIAPNAIVAVTGIEFLKQNQFDLARTEAVKTAPLVFIRDFAVLSAAQEPPVSEGKSSFRVSLSEDAEKFKQCMTEGALEKIRICIRRKAPRWGRLPDARLDVLIGNSTSRLENSIGQLVNILFQKFIILKKPPAVAYTGTQVRVRDINTGTEPVIGLVPFEDVLTVDRVLFSRDVRLQFDAVASDKMKEIPAYLRNVLMDLSVYYLASLNGCHYSPEDTEVSREEARSKILPAAFIMKINRGDTIIGKDEVITEEKFTALQVHNRARFRDKIGRILSIFVQQIIMMGLLVYFISRFARKKISDVSSNFIIFFTLWAFAGILLFLGSSWSDHANYNEVAHFFGSWVPIGLFVVSFSIIFGESLSIPLGLYMSYLVFVAGKYDGISFVIAVTLALTAAILGGRISKRVHFITTALIISALGILLVTAGYMYSHRSILASQAEQDWFSRNYLASIWVAFYSGMATALVIVLLPVYETLFNIPTRFKLTELADPSNKLLQEVFRLAPSTWTHTLMVAAMCEKVCERLKLNTLLARAGVYYHDIGKTRNGSFFIENQHLIPKPEKIDRDNPALAAKIIIDHVLDGLEIAKAARLPREVIAFIPEHHGTSTMSFFYHKALEKMKRKTRREDFRYPGPIPQSKETAIAMIADSVEAASRSLDDVNELSIDALIQRIIQMKLGENQLDESGLTIGDLKVIREAFRDVLLSSFHTRPKYPTTDEVNRLEAGNRKKLRRGK